VRVWRAAIRVHAWRLMAGAFDVLDVRALIGVRLRFGAAFPTQFEHAIAQAPQELPVVRHEQHRPVEVLQGIEQHLLRRQIEVVGRLVEDQEIRRVQEHACENEPCLFAARERADFLVGVVAGELKGAREAA